MKPFDLQAAMAGRPVRTRDGRAARIICTDRRDGLYPVVALVTDDDGGEYAYYYNPGGSFYSDGRESGSDLVMESERHEGWVNVYAYEALRRLSPIFPTEEEARRDKNRDGYVATVHIEWED